MVMVVMIMVAMWWIGYKGDVGSDTGCVGFDSGDTATADDCSFIIDDVDFGGK